MEKCAKRCKVGCKFRRVGNSPEQKGGAHRSQDCAGTSKSKRERPIRVAKEHVFLATWTHNDTLRGWKICNSEVECAFGSAVAMSLQDWHGGACEPAERRFGSAQSRIDEGMKTPRD